MYLRCLVNRGFGTAVLATEGVHSWLALRRCFVAREGGGPASGEFLEPLHDPPEGANRGGDIVRVEVRQERVHLVLGQHAPQPLRPAGNLAQELLPVGVEFIDLMKACFPAASLLRVGLKLEPFPLLGERLDFGDFGKERLGFG